MNYLTFYLIFLCIIIPKNTKTLKVFESYIDINWCILLWEPNILMESIYFLQRFSHTFDGLIHRRMSKTTSQRRYKFLLQCLQTAILFHCLIDSVIFKENCGRKLCDNEKSFSSFSYKQIFYLKGKLTDTNLGNLNKLSWNIQKYNFHNQLDRAKRL